ENLSIDKILTRPAFLNAIKVNSAVGGSTNLVLHLLAIAKRMEIPLTLDDFDIHGSKIPFLLNLMPSGKYLMEDYYYAGGIQVILKELSEHLSQEAITVNGKTLVENSAK